MKEAAKKGNVPWHTSRQHALDSLQHYTQGGSWAQGRAGERGYLRPPGPGLSMLLLPFNTCSQERLCRLFQIEFKST